MKKKDVELIFKRYVCELTERLGVSSYRTLRKKCHELSVEDPEYLASVQNDAEAAAWRWARSVGLPTDDEAWELFQEIRSEHQL